MKKFIAYLIVCSMPFLHGQQNVRTEQEMLAAVFDNDYDRVVSILNDNPVLVNSSYECDLSVLNRAVAWGYVTIPRLLCAKGADVNKKDSMIGFTPLLWAAYVENKDCIELLLEHGADVNAQNNDGDTPLYFCIVNFINILFVENCGYLQPRSNVNAQELQRGFHCLAILVDYDADPSIKNRVGESVDSIVQGIFKMTLNDFMIYCLSTVVQSDNAISEACDL